MINKKGLSAVVTTLIIILLSLVAIGIIWVVVNNILQKGASTTDISAKCLQVDIKATSAGCTAGTCNVTYKRSQGGEDIDGIKIVISNSTESFTEDIPGNINVLDTKTASSIVTGLTTPGKVEIAAYFTDSSGTKQTCGAGTPVTF